MALSTRKIDLGETHSDRRCLCPPPRAVPSILRGTLPRMERFLRLPPVPTLSSSRGAIHLMGSPSTAIDPPQASGDCPFCLATPSPRGSSSDTAGDHQPITLHWPVPSLDQSWVGGAGWSAPPAQDAPGVPMLSMVPLPPSQGLTMARRQLEMATLHQLYTTADDRAKRLKLKGHSLSAHIQDITGHFNETVRPRD